MSSFLQLCQFHRCLLTDPVREAAGKCFEQVHAHEGTLWLLDDAREFLVPVWNSGPRAADFVGTFRQPLDAGLISLACITEQPICENQVCLNERQDPTLDRRLGLRTWSMIAVPLVFNEALRGIVSCVKLGQNANLDEAPAPFLPGDLRQVEQLSERLNQLIGGESREEFAG